MNNQWYKYNTKEPTTQSKPSNTARFSNKKSSSKDSTSTSAENQPEVVLFIPHTPGGILKKELTKVQESFNRGKKYQGIRIVERQGPKVGGLIAKTAPWQKDPCPREFCTPCTEKPGS